MPFRPLADDASILSRALDCYETVRTGNQDLREEMRENLRFRLNDQWSAEAKKLRTGKRPMYVFNVVDRLVDAVAGQARQNPLSIKISPVDGRADKFLAWLLEGVVRAIQYRSGAQRAYAWALECAASLAEGNFRLSIDYESDRSFHPCLKIERIADPFCVSWDPRSTDPVGKDADYVFFLQKFTRDQFKETFGEENEPTENDLDRELIREWYEKTGNDAASVKKYLVAEFYWKEFHTKWIGSGADGATVEMEGKPTEYQGQTWGVYQGEWIPLVQAREVKTHRIRGAFVSGHKVLEVFDWPGRHFPFYRVVGKEVHGDGKRFVKSAISNARDPQRVLNNVFTGAAEAVNANVQGKWVAVWKTVKNYWARYWSKSNDPSENVLPYDPDPTAPNGGKPEWVSPPVQIAGQFAIGEQSLNLLRYTTGIGEETSGLRSNAQSGRAILARVQESDENTAAFPDNLNAAVECLGEELCYLVPRYYRGSRIVQAVLEEDSSTPEPITLPMGQELTPEFVQQIQQLAQAKQIPVPEVLDALELREGEYDVAVSVSRAWATRRMEAQEAVLGMLQYMPPDLLSEIVDLVFENADWPGAYGIAERIRQFVQERRQSQAMGSAADQALQALTSNPIVAAALESLTRKTVAAYLQGQAGPGLPAPSGEPPVGFQPPMMDDPGMADSMMMDPGMDPMGGMDVQP